MANERGGAQRRRKLSRAEIKAYEARRAAERRRLALQSADVERDDAPITHSYTMTRDDEYAVIRSDLIRLGWVCLVLAVLLAIATFFLA
ncbi:MAG TPA: hypothetical protein VKZ96_03650 [Thermomicrobiales bacterium]|nr:hypothetical protein [Thermomicrobiales bacterium]